MLSIRALSELTGVTPEAVRYYEREGIIPAATRDGPGRYRKYGPSDVERLRFVRRARNLGFSLAEVRELLTLADGTPNRACTDVDRIASAHLAQVDVKIAQLNKLRAELHQVIAGCSGGVAVAECQILAALARET